MGVCRRALGCEWGGGERGTMCRNAASWYYSYLLGVERNYLFYLSVQPHHQHKPSHTPGSVGLVLLLSSPSFVATASSRSRAAQLLRGLRPAGLN